VTCSAPASGTLENPYGWKCSALSMVSPASAPICSSCSFFAVVRELHDAARDHVRDRGDERPQQELDLAEVDRASSERSLRELFPRADSPLRYRPCSAARA
jgi:hypothetical protein